MANRAKDIRGFTLAELLLAIAIMVVLFALAVPSIFSIQKNMRMVELDAAASDIAVAAQQQMTSMKVSGTWVGLLDEHPELTAPTETAPTATAPAPTATGVPSEVTDAHPEPNDLFYLTADQARTLGILPSASIDDDVREGDYVIEYSASTATVFGVFYTDGKTGFFQTPTKGTAAEDFYKGDTTAVKRTQASRMKNNTLIGYYGGTPAGATNAVALANPNIWVEDDDASNNKGKLCIQDTNLSKHPEWNTYLEVTITKEGENGGGTKRTFAFAGLQGDNLGNTYSAGADLEHLSEYSNEGTTKLYEVAARDRTSAQVDVYVFDLEMFKNSGDADLVALVEGFSQGDTVTVTATVKTNQKPYTPATAAARIEWPDLASVLRIVVTDPASEDNIAGGGHIEGTYTKPTVKSVPKSAGDKIQEHAADYSESHTIASTNAQLITENSEASTQRYSGSQISLEQATDDDIYLRASVGWYTPKANGQSGSLVNHPYQIQEIWIGIGSNPASSTKEKIGYLRDNAWEWTESGRAYASCFTDLSETGAGDKDFDTHGVYSIDIDPNKFEKVTEDLGLEDKTITIYVRTSPDIDEVRTFFTGKSSRTGTEEATARMYETVKLVDGGTTASARGTGQQAVGIREWFEAEFGCPSSDAVWSITRKPNSDNQPIQELFPGNNIDVRTYYAITPAFGFNGKLDAPENCMTNAALWYYSDADKTVYPQAMVYPSRSGGEYFMGTGGPDFEFRTDRDYLFYRVLRFYDSYEEVTASTYRYTDPIESLKVQYVPFSASDDPSVATIPSAGTKTVDGVTMIGVGWKTFNVNTYLDTPITQVDVKNGDLVADYHDVLDYKGTYLVAKYQDVSLGLMYLEFDSEGATTACGGFGYTNSDPSAEEAGELPSNAYDIAEWGYYVVVPEAVVGDSSFQLKKTAGKCSLSSSDVRSVVVDGVPYSAYKVIASGDGAKTTQQVSFALDKKDAPTISATFFINFNFAAAVSPSEKAASAWGEESSPWKVRHATQFVGSLPWNGFANSVQAAYVGDCFEQTQDIDFSDIAYNESGKVTGTYQFKMAFTGSYDGKTNAIRGFDRMTYTYNATGNVNRGDSVECSAGKGQGLFPCVQGVEGKQAVLKNIKLVPTDGLVEAYGSDATTVYFGFLVGVLDNALVSNCSLDGYDAGTNKNTMLVLERLQKENGTIGLLVGKAQDSTIRQSVVNGISATCASRSSDWKTIQVGGLVGMATVSGSNDGYTEIEKCSVTDTMIMIQEHGSPQEACFGGIVGNAHKTEVIWATVNGVKIIVNQGSSLWKNAYFGGIFGRASSLIAVESNVSDLLFTLPDRQPQSQVQCGLVAGYRANDEWDINANTYGQAIRQIGQSKFDVIVSEFGWPL